jgi:transposase
MSLAPALVLREGDRERLADLARLPSVPSGLAKRARMVLLAADGVPNAQIARAVGVSRPTVIGWRDRYQRGGIKALEDQPRSGRPPRIDEVDVVVATLANDGRLQPHRVETFKFSTDPQLEAKVRDVVGLYLAPPDNAVVVSVDEKSQIQALDRTQPGLPLRPGLVARRTHDYKRHGTTTLFAALEVATGKITADACYPRHRHQEFLAFLKKVAAAHPGADLHVVLDNYGTHKHPEIRRWLAKPENQQITLHFTPTGCSWLNMVEIFFGIITRQALRRGSFTSVKDLIAAIGNFIDAYNGRCQPFSWTKDADKLLAKIRPKKN